MRYRLRPPVDSEIEAERFNGSLDEVSALSTWSEGRVFCRDGCVFVMTRDGNGISRVYPGDYVVRNRRGDYGVMTARVLDERFEVVFSEELVVVQSIAQTRLGRPPGGATGTRDEPAELPMATRDRRWVQAHSTSND